jgi:hypothetical protein
VKRLLGAATSVCLGLFACTDSLVAFPVEDAGQPIAVVDAGLACGTGTTQCADRCVATAIDDQNCGRCGATCTASEGCAASQCLPRDCSGADCAAQQLCVNDETCLERACVGVRCPTGQTCFEGTCQPEQCNGVTCEAGNVCASGRCTDVQCVGVQCRAGATCSKGKCSTPTTMCSDAGLETDVANCGACGVVCPSAIQAPTACTRGTCGRGTCNAGFFDVDGPATPGCESTCAGSTCTLPDGGSVVLTRPPTPEARGNFGVVSSGGSLGNTRQSNASFRHSGVMGDAAATGGARMSNGVFQNVGGITGLGR